MNESQAIRLCIKRQDPAGFEYLVKKYRREAYVHAYALLGSREDAADVCQESFTRAYTGMPRATALTSFYPWFYRILRNCCLNFLSRQQTVRSYAKSHNTQAPVTAEIDESFRIVNDAEEQRRVWATLAGLAPEFREILILKYIQDHQYQYISELLDIPRGTVMSRLYYARKAFQAGYSEHDTDA